MTQQTEGRGRSTQVEEVARHKILLNKAEGEKNGTEIVNGRFA